MCFVPWVYTLNLGMLIYQPYEADGKERYYRTTGPLPQLFMNAQWTSSAQIPKVCKKALVAAEDMKFYEHLGIDPDSIQQAFKRNEHKGKIKLGGSTITQQLVKNAFLSRDKSYLRKAREAVGALLLDLALDKNDQITWYFNIVEFGPHIYGIDEAASHYFKKKPEQLSVDQCVQLVAILPAPKRYHLSIKKGQATPYLQRRISSIKKRLTHVQAA